MKESTKAKKLQTRLAIDILSGNTPKQARLAAWVYPPSNIWHLEGKMVTPEKHCSTCRCFGNQPQAVLHSVCGGVQWSQYHMKWASNNVPSNARPCKRCLASLDKIAKSGE